jgi:transcription antitermination factor NusG
MMGTTIKPTRNNFIVKNPIKPMSTTLQLTDEVKEQYAAEQLKNASKAEVVAVGPSVLEIKVGDFVKIKSGRFMYGEPIEGDKHLLFGEGDVIAVY